MFTPTPGTAARAIPTPQWRVAHRPPAASPRLCAQKPMVAHRNHPLHCATMVPPTTAPTPLPVLLIWLPDSGSGGVRVALRDRMYSVIALVGWGVPNLTERYEYNPYGERIVLDSDYTLDADGESDFTNPFGDHPAPRINPPVHKKINLPPFSPCRCSAMASELQAHNSSLDAGSFSRYRYMDRIPARRAARQLTLAGLFMRKPSGKVRL